jgi:NADH pyrophosphatase NudC (nudix superfamily)
MAFGRSTDLNVDNNEIEEARWFSQNEINLIIQNNHPEKITIPSERTIAHQLINHWNQNSGQLI